MKITAPHWVIAVLVLLGVVAPQLAAQVPTLAPYMNVVIQIDPILLGALGVATASAFPKPTTPPILPVLSLFCLPALFALLCGCASGTISPQTQAEIQAAEVLGACIESTYATDSQKVPSPSPLQIALDEATVCGADAADLLTTFGNSPTAGKKSVADVAQPHAAELRNARLRASK